jgi:tRNA-specific 2-thiouridylase
MGKDQSYVLAVLTRDQLAHAMFPLGDITKDQVREEARQRGLAVADKPDSHDICFIADGNTQGFLAKHLGEAPGPIVDTDGATVGSHDGTYGFTIGQRRGLHLDHPADDGRPRYVLSIEPVSRTVTVGTASDLEIHDITAQHSVWTGCDPLTEPRDCGVQLRAHGTVYPCVAQYDGETLQLTLTEPARGIAAGQTAVLYDGDTVLGSATITATRVPVSS